MLHSSSLNMHLYNITVSTQCTHAYTHTTHCLARMLAYASTPTRTCMHARIHAHIKNHLLSRSPALPGENISKSLFSSISRSFSSLAKFACSLSKTMSPRVLLPLLRRAPPLFSGLRPPRTSLTRRNANDREPEHWGGRIMLAAWWVGFRLVVCSISMKHAWENATYYVSKRKNIMVLFRPL